MSFTIITLPVGLTTRVLFGELLPEEQRVAEVAADPAELFIAASWRAWVFGAQLRELYSISDATVDRILDSVSQSLGTGELCGLQKESSSRIMALISLGLARMRGLARSMRRMMRFAPTDRGMHLRR